MNINPLLSTCCKNHVFQNLDSINPIPKGYDCKHKVKLKCPTCNYQITLEIIEIHSIGGDEPDFGLLGFD